MLERAIADGRVADAANLKDWIVGSLAHGALKTDAILLAHAYRGEADAGKLAELADLGLALTAASERHFETSLTGETFSIAARAWPSDVFARLPQPCPYPVVVGATAGAQEIGIDETLLGYLTAAVHSQVSVAVRLVPLGQTAGLQVLAGLEPAVAALAATAAMASLDDIGGIAYAADIAQMRHETMGMRVFRS
jgi:urease accessory protein